MDVVVTVPKTQWDRWLLEGNLAGDEWDGQEYVFWVGQAKPKIEPGERVYVAAHGLLRGYAPLIRIIKDRVWYGLVRGGGAVAVTIHERIRGFQGYRYRWWGYDVEHPFPNWQLPTLLAQSHFLKEETAMKQSSQARES